MKSRTMVMGVSGSRAFEEAVALEAVDKLREYYLPWIERALQSLGDDLVWRRPREGVNSIGNLLLHLNGNITQWVLHGVAGEEDRRDRPSEFAADEGASGEELLRILRATVDRVCDVILQPRTAEEWTAERTIQGFQTSTLAATIHVVEHFSYHTGQIVLLAKSATGEDFGFFDV